MSINISYYEKKKEKQKVSYIKIMLENPEVLRLYMKILKYKNYLESSLIQYSSNAFKILFWDFLLGKVYRGRFDFCKSKFLADFFEKEEKKGRFSKLSPEDYNNKELDDINVREYFPQYDEVNILNNYLYLKQQVVLLLPKTLKKII